MQEVHEAAALAAENSKLKAKLAEQARLIAQQVRMSPHSRAPPPLRAPLSWTTCGSSAPTGSCGVYCCADDGEPFTIAWASLSWDANKINTAFPLT